METQDCLGMGLALPNETRKCWECRKVTVWLCLRHIILIQDALYGSTTVSDTFGEGMTEKVSIMPQLFKVHEKCQQGMFGSWIWWREQKGIERTFAKHTCKWDAVWIFLTHFGDQQCAHSSAGAATERMAKLEALQTSLVELSNQKERPLSLHLNSTQYCHNTGEEIKFETTVWICLAKWQLQLYYSRQASVASLCFFSDNIKYWVNQLSTFGVVTLTGFFNYKLMKNHTKLKPRTQPCLCPIVARTCPTIQTQESNHMAIQPHNFRHLEGLCQSAIAWSVGQRNFQSKHSAKRHPVTSLSAQRQSYLGETTGQMDQHEHCPWCLQGNQIWFQQARC